MADRDKAICDLQILRTWCAVDPIYGIGLTCRECEMAVGWIDNALALLKEQEPHVLSRDEMIEAGKNHEAVYVEEGAGRCFWGLAVEGIEPPEKGYNYPGGVLFNVIDADGGMWDGDFYLMCSVYPEVKPHPMGWRAWSAKPTQKQMREVRWE